MTKLIDATIGELEAMNYPVSGFDAFVLAQGWL